MMKFILHGINLMTGEPIASDVFCGNDKEAAKFTAKFKEHNYLWSIEWID